MTGGAAALYASVLDAGGPVDAMARVVYVQRLVAVGAAALNASSTTTADLQDRADRLQAAAETRTTTASEVQQRYVELDAVIDELTAELAALSERASDLQQAQDLLAQVAALNAAVDATGAARVSTARASAIPAAFRALYVAAARTCRGMSWTLLAAVGQVESGHGANTNDVLRRGAGADAVHAGDLRGVRRGRRRRRRPGHPGPGGLGLQRGALPVRERRRPRRGTRWSAPCGTTTTPTGTSPWCSSWPGSTPSATAPDHHVWTPTHRTYGVFGVAESTAGAATPPSIPPMPLSASPSSLGTIQTLLASPCAIFGSTWRYW